MPDKIKLAQILKFYDLLFTVVDPAVQIDDQVSEVHIPFGDDTLVIPGIVRYISLVNIKLICS